MESFFSWLKLDRTREQAKADLFNFIEHFYNNPTRRQSTLGYFSPMAFNRYAD